MIVERVSYHGWENSYHLSSGEVEMIVTADVGPRVIHFGPARGENMLHVFPDDLGQAGGDTFRFYGGHRLWHAPEDDPRTYDPDNNPVQLVQTDTDVTFTAPVEPNARIEKSLQVAIAADGIVTLTHRLTNRNLWPVELAAWSLTMMRAGGVGVMPLIPRQRKSSDTLLPNTPLILWPYTSLADPRLQFGPAHVLLHQNTENTNPHKLGTYNPEAWMGYVLDDTLFIKRVDGSNVSKGAVYPDHGCNLEMYTDHNLLETETLGPLTRLAPGETTTHVERWSLHRDVPAPQSESDYTEQILPRVAFG